MSREFTPSLDYLEGYRDATFDLAEALLGRTPDSPKPITKATREFALNLLANCTGSLEQDQEAIRRDAQKIAFEMQERGLLEP